MMWDHQVLAVAAAKLAQRPVRLALSRKGVFRATGGRTLTEQRVALAATSPGALAALIHTGVVANGPDSLWPEQFTFPARVLYASGTMKLGQEIATLNMVAPCPMRAPGESVGTFALESALDELAVAMDIDPLELRRRIEPTQEPSSGRAFSSRHLLQAYARGAERFGWSARSKTPRSRREGDWLIGHGVATGTYPYYRMPGGAASIRLTADGHAIVRMASHEMGMGTATVQAQYAAERLGLPVECVAFEHGDSDYPAGTLAGGSSQTASIIAAVTAAADKLFKELLELAGKDSPLHGLQADRSARRWPLPAQRTAAPRKLRRDSQARRACRHLL
jgi:xanthine dehydrogenase YagR molybdenum-binding subunit